MMDNRVYDNIAILIPVYQPEDRLPQYISYLRKYFKCIVVVNDGSGNEFIQIFDSVREMGGDVLLHNVNLGKGRALKTGLNHIYGIKVQFVITVDGDSQHTIKDVLAVADKLSETGGDRIVLGARDFSGSVPLRNKFGNRMTKAVFKWLCGLDLADTQTGLRGFSIREIPWMLAVDGEKYDYETNVLLRAKERSIRFQEISVTTIYNDSNSASHFNPFKDSLRIYWMILKYLSSSIISVIVDYSVFYFYTSAGGSMLNAIAIGRTATCVVNFTINQNIVFRSSGNNVIQAIKYLMLVAVSGTLSYMGIELLRSLLSLDGIACKVIVESILFFLNFYVQRAFIFTEMRYKR